MRILILHRIPYCKIDYARGIDHSRHEVVYIGKAADLENIPDDLRCRKVARPGRQSAYPEIAPLIRHHEPFDRIISLSEYELSDASRLRRLLNVAGPTCEDTLLVRDKVTMKAAIRKAGLQAPRFLRGSSLQPCALAGAPWVGKTVLKPVAGAASENVKICDSLPQAWRELQTLAQVLGVPPSEFELEEYVDGPIVHFDGLVANGDLCLLTASRYVGTCLEFANGRPLGSYQFDAGLLAKNWVRQCLEAVNLKTGSFHLEAIESNHGLVFLEVGARVGGADVVDAVELRTGVHLPSAELSLILDPKARPEALLRPNQNYFGWFVYPAHSYPNGWQVRVRNDWAANPQVIKWHLLERGHPKSTGISYQAFEAPLAGIVGARSPREVEAAILGIFASVEVEQAHAAQGDLPVAQRMGV